VADQILIVNVYGLTEITYRRAVLIQGCPMGQPFYQSA